jgi:hypothetical protein
MSLVKKILTPILIVIFIISVFLIVSYFINKNQGKGALQITSVPKSKVYLDGKLIGETPLCKCEYPNLIDSGIHDIKLVPSQSNLNTFEDKIKIFPSVLTVVDRSFGQGALSEGSIITLYPTSDKDAEISVISFPDKVEVALDNDPSGTTPLLLKDQTESDHEIKLTKDGYKDKSIRIRAIKGYRLEATVFLSIGGNSSSSSAVPLAAPTPTTVSVTQVIIGETPTGFLRVRDSASLGGAEVAEVNPGEKYDLLDEQTGWYQIKLKDGKTGWISSQYATKE